VVVRFEFDADAAVVAAADVVDADAATLENEREPRPGILPAGPAGSTDAADANDDDARGPIGSFCGVLPLVVATRPLCADADSAGVATAAAATVAGVVVTVVAAIYEDLYSEPIPMAVSEDEVFVCCSQ